MRGICLLLLLLIATWLDAGAQIDVGRAVEARMLKGKWMRAELSIKKVLRKDPDNVEARLLYARYYLSPQNPHFNIDSSYHAIQQAVQAWAIISVRQKERLQRISIDSGALVKYRKKIDSAAFERAKGINSEQGYNFFIEQFTTASQQGKAIELRDELSFVEALKVNTAATFKAYLDQFPESHRVPDANDRYEKLLYEENTRDGMLNSFETFLLEYPQTQYRRQVEQRIFELSTAAGSALVFYNFLSHYPESALSKRAADILFYLPIDPIVKKGYVVSDSLRLLEQLNKGYWIPFFRNNLYGFMDEEGKEVMEQRFTSIDSTYLCGNIQQDFLLTSSGLYSRKGIRLWNGTPEKVVDLGLGFLKVSTGACQLIVHKSGFSVGPDCVEDARLVADQFLAVKENGKWGLLAMNGLRLLAAAYEDVIYIDKVVMLIRSGKKILIKVDQLAALAIGAPLNDSLVFDDVRSWGEGNLLVKNGSLEGVLNQQLAPLIPLDRQTLTKTSFGFITAKSGMLKVVGTIPQLEAETFQDVKDYGDWLELRQGQKRMLYAVSSRKIIASGLDSLWIRDKVAFGRKRDSVYVFMPSGHMAAFDQASPVTFISGTGNRICFWVPEKKSKVVFDAIEGKRLFIFDFDAIESMGKDLFVFQKKKKKGLLRADGKVMQPAVYDEIIPAGNFISLLKDKKFGLYDPEKQLLIKPVYERNVLAYSAKYFIAFKGAYGLITSDEKGASPFEFDEIRYWNDTAAWVRKNFTWAIYTIQEGQIRAGRIRNFQTIKDDADEKIVRIYQDNYYGVISNKRGVIIPSSFTDIINIGSEEKPFYFTGKRVEEADIEVVIYYNASGKFIRKQVYEGSDYDRIYCEDD